MEVEAGDRIGDLGHRVVDGGYHLLLRGNEGGGDGAGRGGVGRGGDVDDGGGRGLHQLRRAGADAAHGHAVEVAIVEGDAVHRNGRLARHGGEQARQNEGRQHAGDNRIAGDGAADAGPREHRRGLAGAPLVFARGREIGGGRRRRRRRVRGRRRRR